jgi:hypothetical protein
MPTKRQPPPATNERPDVERCIESDCIGGFCPCLCHTSLKLDHADLRPAVKRGRA